MHAPTPPTATPKDNRRLISVMLYTDHHWRTFFDLVERPELSDDPRFRTMSSRTANTDALYGLLESEHKARTTGDWLELLHAHRIPATKVNSVTDILNYPHVPERTWTGRIRAPRA